jgi:hypothetical protein
MSVGVCPNVTSEITWVLVMCPNVVGGIAWNITQLAKDIIQGD